jgi:hypothetical protein
MALRKTAQVFFAALLVILAGGTSVRAQESKIDPIRFRDRVLNSPHSAEPGVRPIQIARGMAASQNSMAPAGIDFPPPKYRTSGREFFLVFPSIVGNAPVAGDPAKRSLYISSRGRTRVHISIDRHGWSEDIVTVPGKVSVVELPSWAALRQVQFENVYDLGITVKAEDEITVYGYSHENLSTDGFLILPKETLGQHYMVASQRNSLNYSGDWQDPYNPRSMFVMLATEDQTLITFKLTALSQSGNLLKDTIYNIILNRGEAFPIMARDTGYTSTEPYTYKDNAGNLVTIYMRMYSAPIPNADCDLTGSEIWADKPIAVFSGHERASTPDVNEFDMERLLRNPDLGISRDHLTEQMPPVELWGNEFFVMGSINDRFETRPAGGDVVRVISAIDNNVITVNGVSVANLNSGKYYQFMSGDIAHVQTSQPSLVVKYMQSMSKKANESNGDPDMTVVAPISNLSTAYTLPVVDNNLVFREPFVNVIAHDLGLKSLRVNGKPPQSRAKKIAGTEYTWFTEWGSPGEWRIECDLPCYAESFAYGYADSYTFGGGGDFKYQDSLFAENLDFKTLLINRTRDLTANVTAGYDLNLLVDSITIYDITWLDGDIANFEMLDKITTPVKLGPGDKLPVRFRFRPTAVREYRAKAWVWSSSRALVYIEVIGQGGLMTVEITPRVLDFGRVRLDQEATKSFSVLFGGDDNLATVRLLASTYPDLKNPKLGFHIPDVPASEHGTGTAYTSSVRFKPLTEGWRDTGFTVYAALPQTQDISEKLNVRLIGRGVMPNVQTEDIAYGEVRVGKMTDYRDIEIRNLGSDSTKIMSIELESGMEDFTLDPASLPPVGHILDTTDVEGSRYRFRARFNPMTVGNKTARVKIKTLEQTLYSTLTGTGVEPYIIADPVYIDFGRIESPVFPNPVDNPTKTFKITNIGTYEAIVDKLIQTTEGTKNFVLKPVTASQNINGEIVAKTASIDVDVTFLVSRVGEYFDTVSVLNDTRNQPLVILRGRVVSDTVRTSADIDFDTVRDCAALIDSVTIYNDNSVGIVIDTIFFEGQSDGFDFAGIPFYRKINIEAGKSFTFPIQYVFPKDSLTGLQRAKLVLLQQVADETVRLEVLLEVYRDIKTLSLMTVKPAYTPNATDARPFKLPITIVGDHEGLHEFDNFTLLLHFDNDLFEPVGIETIGTLTEIVPPSVSRIQAAPYDAVNRVYTITGTDLDVSKRKGDLLLKVLVRAKLTVDTFATVTPELNLSERPCAYAVTKQGILLEYANDCGDELLRDKLVDELAFRVISVSPEPLVTSTSSATTMTYFIGYDAELEAEVLSASGAVVITLPVIQATKGTGTIVIPAEGLTASGLYVLRVRQRSSDGVSDPSVYSRTFRVIR